MRARLESGLRRRFEDELHSLAPVHRRNVMPGSYLFAAIMSNAGRRSGRLAQLAEDGPSVATTFAQGGEVFCKGTDDHGEHVLFRGVIDAVNPDGTIAVHFDDGDCACIALCAELFLSRGPSPYTPGRALVLEVVTT